MTPPALRLAALAGLALAGLGLAGLVLPGTGLSGVAASAAAPGRLPASAAREPADSDAAALLERAEEAAAEESYTGTLMVEWRDAGQRRRAEVAVTCAGGVLRLGDHVVGAGAQRMVKGPGGWSTLWGRDVIALGPSPEAKYDFTLKAGPPVAGRPTNLVEVRLDGRSQLRERIHLDTATGLLLRRELVGPRGRPYRSVGFSSFTRVAEPPIMPARSVGREPEPTVRVSAPYEAPNQLGAGYRLVGAYHEPGQVVHLFYSDGLHGLSVFEQPGRLRGSGTPAGGRRVEVGGHPVRAYSTSAGETVLWEGEGVVYTVVSDAPFSDVASAVAMLPHAPRDGRLRQLADVVVSIFRWR